MYSTEKAPPDFYKKLRKWREYGKLSQTEAASILGVNFHTFVGWEGDKHTPGTAPSYLELLRKMEQLGRPLE